MARKGTTGGNNVATKHRTKRALTLPERVLLNKMGFRSTGNSAVREPSGAVAIERRLTSPSGLVDVDIQSVWRSGKVEVVTVFVKVNSETIFQETLTYVG